MRHVLNFQDNHNMSVLSRTSVHTTAGYISAVYMTAVYIAEVNVPAESAMNTTDCEGLHISCQRSSKYVCSVL